MKTIAMIPARMGSKRIEKKNIRILNGKPLISYVIEAAIEANCFDEIYINSESEVFKDIAETYKIKFYKRPEELSNDDKTNDHFTEDFLTNIECDTLIQLLPTSPFITKKEIVDFTNKMLTGKYDTLISVTNQQIESLYDGSPINFDNKKITPPSQSLKSIQTYACSLMGWTKENYISNMNKYKAGYHGGDGKKGYFTLKGFSTIDIDNEEDFQLAEITAKHLKSKDKFPVYYYRKGEVFDSDRLRVLLEDGVTSNINMDDCNKEVVSIDEIIKNNPKDEFWSHTLVNSKSNCATLIAQMPGEGNRLHYHSDWDEWWYIIQGQWEWFVDGETMIVKKGDMVFIERDKRHKITAVGDGQSIRLAVNREDINHIYPPDGEN